MRIDLSCDQHQLAWGQLVERVRYAEQAGFTGAWVFDHFKALYGSPDGPCFEAWSCWPRWRQSPPPSAWARW